METKLKLTKDTKRKTGNITQRKWNGNKSIHDANGNENGNGNRNGNGNEKKTKTEENGNVNIRKQKNYKRETGNGTKRNLNDTKRKR